MTSTAPSYSLHISPTGPEGFHDMIGSEINEAVGLSEEESQNNELNELKVEAPESVAEASLDNDVYTSSQELNQ